MKVPLPPLGVRRACFAAYALTLVVLTHWPQIRIEGPIARPDLYIHFVAFGLWSVLLNFARPFGWPTEDRRSQISCGAVALSYALIDEGTQAIAIFGRVFDLADLAANAGGSLLGSLLVAIVTLRTSAKAPDAGG